MKKKVALVIMLTIGTLSLSGCESVMQASVGSEDIDKQQVSPVGKYDITNHDLDVSAEEEIEINLDDLTEDMEGIYSFRQQCLTLNEPGDYILSGSLTSGNIVVNVYDDEIVHLILCNAEIHSDKKPAITIEKADKVIITVTEGTENVLSDGPRHVEGQEACIFSNSDLTINGSGTLHVYGYHANAIHSKDQLKIIGTNLTARAKSDGMKGNDGVILIDGVVDIECEGSGLVSKSEKDMVVIHGGSCKVIAGEYAVTANKYVTLDDCDVDFYSALETVKCNGIRDFDEELIK